MCVCVCCSDTARKGSPVDKIVVNLAKLLCTDAARTPAVELGAAWPPAAPSGDDALDGGLASVASAASSSGADSLTEGAIARY